MARFNMLVFFFIVPSMSLSTLLFYSIVLTEYRIYSSPSTVNSFGQLIIKTTYFLSATSFSVDITLSSNEIGKVFSGSVTCDKVML